MSVYLLDTCTLSDYLRRNKQVVQKLHNQRSSRLAVSTITQYEIQFGLLNKPALISQYRPQLNELYSKIEVIPVDEQVAYGAASIHIALKQAGQLIEQPDILIAATASVHDLIVVTSNTKHFRRIKGLRIENWKI